jgi:hypothetical protein
MTRIVRTHYRYKRPPKRKKPVALEVPAVITAASKRRRVSADAKAVLAASNKLAPAELGRKPVVATKRTLGSAIKSAIVTVRSRKARSRPPARSLDLMPEEMMRRVALSMSCGR